MPCFNQNTTRYININLGLNYFSHQLFFSSINEIKILININLNSTIKALVYKTEESLRYSMILPILYE